MGIWSLLPHGRSLAGAGVDIAYGFEIFHRLKFNARVVCWDLHGFQRNLIEVKAVREILPRRLITRGVFVGHKQVSPQNGFLTLEIRPPV